jgi:hypothetical protein
MSHEQFCLPFLDTTSPCGGLALYPNLPALRATARPTLIGLELEEPHALIAPSKFAVPAIDYRLVGDRKLADGRKGRAVDNLAAIRLARLIESEGRCATPNEQERLARFTAFGASDVADKLFAAVATAFLPPGKSLASSSNSSFRARIWRACREQRNTRISRRSSSSARSGERSVECLRPPQHP